MVKFVIKRDGRIVEFDKRKIVDAVLKAMDVTEEGEDIVLAAEIAATISKIGTESMSVEDIQDHVEMELMNSPRKEVAKKYIAYRNQRNLARKAKSREIFKEIIEAQATDVTRENANMNADTPAGMMMKFASESTKSFVDECLLSEDVVLRYALGLFVKCVELVLECIVAVELFQAFIYFRAAVDRIINAS